MENFVKEYIHRRKLNIAESKKIQKYQHYAARFAVKEAVFKAISAGLKDKYQISWKDIEVKNDSNGRPYVKIKEEFMKEVEDIDISISHCKKYAVATVVVLEK